MKKIMIAGCVMLGACCSAQKVKTDFEPMWVTFLPKTVIPTDSLTFSCVTIESPQNDNYRSSSIGEGTNWNTSTSNLIGGYKNVGPAKSPTLAVTIRTEPFSISGKNLQQVSSASGPNGSTVTSYSYDIKSNYVLNVVVVRSGDTVMRLTRNQGAMTQVNFPNSVKPMSTTAMSFNTSGALESEYSKNNRDIMVVVKKKCNDEFLKFLADTINAVYGYPSEKLFFEIATAKSKSFNYDDLDSAKDYIKRAMDSVTAHSRANQTHNWSFASSRVLVQKAIVIWEKALTEESADKKARIHPELAGYIRLNLALAYMMIDNYQKAEELYSKCKTDPELSNGTIRNIDFVQKNYLPRFKAGYTIHKNRL